MAARSDQRAFATLVYGTGWETPCLAAVLGRMLQQLAPLHSIDRVALVSGLSDEGRAILLRDGLWNAVHEMTMDHAQVSSQNGASLPSSSR